jgi:hypothetical protein
VIMSPGEKAAPWLYGDSFESSSGTQAIFVRGTRTFLVASTRAIFCYPD